MSKKNLKIYVASSWRNEVQPTVVRLLREAGHEVYDFKNPPKDTGFAWSKIEPNHETWTVPQFIKNLGHEKAYEGFRSDFDAMKWCDMVIMVNPCGSSAHLELGWGAGAGKLTAVYCPAIREPELMIKVADLITDDFNEVLKYAEFATGPQHKSDGLNFEDWLARLNFQFYRVGWMPRGERYSDTTGPEVWQMTYDDDLTVAEAVQEELSNAS